MQNIKITISGELGSGKSVLSKLICEQADFKIISVGGIQRELAEKHGMTTLEFNKYMETHPEIDIECDKKVEEYGLSNSNLILDSRMAWHFVPHAFKIHLIVSIDIAAARIFNDTVRKNEENNDIEHTIQNILIRKGSEVKRFKEQYKVDINNFNNYDVVIDSSYIAPEALAAFVLDKFEQWKTNVSFPKVWLSPKNAYPMQSIREHSNSYVKDIKDSIVENGFDILEPIQVIQKEGDYFIYNGHKRCCAAIETGMDLIPVSIINAEKDTLPNGQLFSEYIKDNYTLKNIYDWEDMHDFRFAKYL